MFLLIVPPYCHTDLQIYKIAVTLPRGPLGKSLFFCHWDCLHSERKEHTCRVYTLINTRCGQRFVLRATTRHPSATRRDRKTGYASRVHTHRVTYRSRDTRRTRVYNSIYIIYIYGVRPDAGTSRHLGTRRFRRR